MDSLRGAKGTQNKHPFYEKPKTLKRNVRMEDAESHGEQNCMDGLTSSNGSLVGLCLNAVYANAHSEAISCMTTPRCGASTQCTRNAPKVIGNHGCAGWHGRCYFRDATRRIVAEIQSVPGEDRCVILLGYKEKLVEMFQIANPGLSRRSPMADAFHFHDFSDSEMRQILELRSKEQGLDATEKAKPVTIEVLAQARNRPNVGNAGEVENLPAKAKASHQTKQSSKSISERPFDIIFEAQDFDIDFNGNGLLRYRIFVLRVIGCFASDLIGQYVGQTGPKTRSLLGRALGKVLFIDEAYRLGEGQYAAEIIDELVDIVTKPKFFGKSL
jgi:AAA lid domain